MRNQISSVALLLLLAGCAPDRDGGDKITDTGLFAARTAVIEASIASIQSGIRSGEMACIDVVNAYIERIEHYDQNSGLNAISYKNYDTARARAADVDRRMGSGQSLLPLFCVPMLVKDNTDVHGFPTTAGSKMLLQNMPPDDAQTVKNLKAAGAIVLAKTNMAEWAFSPRRTKSTSAGITRNAYNLDYVPAGSSGGTASGVAANLALIGLGTDTGNSVRGPSSHLSLVGMRSTHSLIDLDGIVPLVLSADVVGPMSKSVEDNLKFFSVMAGQDYTSALDKAGLVGARIGVVRELANDENMDGEIAELFEAALADMKAQGAVIIDPVSIKDIAAHIDAPWGCKSFRKDVHEYLTQPGMNAGISDPYEAYDAGIYAAYTEGSWGYFKDGLIDKALRSDGSECGDLSKDTLRQTIKTDIIGAMDAANLDALVYPSWRYPAAHLDRAEEDYKGDNSQALAPSTGLPAITIPMGFVSHDRPAGLQLLGRSNAELTLYKLAYAYEQATTHRRAPSGFAVIKNE